jgi:hypothetical protein
MLLISRASRQNFGIFDAFLTSRCQEGERQLSPYSGLDKNREHEILDSIYVMPYVTSVSRQNCPLIKKLMLERT